MIYDEGQYTERSTAEAQKCFEAAAESGNPDAECRLAAYYENGVNGAPDPQKAAGLYRSAAANGSTEASYRLALMYRDGRGMPVDCMKAYVWSALSISAGNQSPDVQSLCDLMSRKLTLDELNEAQREASVVFEDWNRGRFGTNS